MSRAPRPVRFGKREVDWLVSLVSATASGPVPEAILSKLRASLEAEATGPSVAPIEAELVAHSRGRIVALASGGYGRAGAMAKAVGATPGDAVLVGQWLARQGWFRGTTTILTVLAKWPEWLAKARAERVPARGKEGFDGQDVEPPGGHAPAGGRGGGRRSEGFGG